MNRLSIFIISLILIIIILIGAWWYFFFERGALPAVPNQNTASSTRPGFTPLNPNTNPTQTSTSSVSSNNSTTTATGTDNEPLPKIRKLYTGPVAIGITGSSTASTTSVFFADRGTGHIYNADIDVKDPTKISNTTIVRVYESLIDPKGKNILFRYIREGSETITTVYAPIAQDIKAKFISNSISAAVLSPKGDRMFYLEKNSAGVNGFISKLDGTSKVEVFDSPLSEWVVTWPEESTVTLTTKASRLNPGFLYFLNTKTAVVTKILGPLTGLTTNTSSDVKKVMYSRVISSRTENKVLSLADGSNQDLIIQTLPEKCVWSTINKSSLYCAVPTEPKKNMPDDWYKGLVRSTDQIWHLDTITNEVYKVSNLFAETGTSIDAVNLVMDPKEQALFFINYVDLSLWSVDLID